jgi:hypothetical protein
MPEEDGEFNRWFRKFLGYVGEKTGGERPAWTHIPREELERLNTLYADWLDDYGFPGDLPDRNRAAIRAIGRAVAESGLEFFIEQWLMGEEVSDPEREEMELVRIRRWEMPAVITVSATAPELEPRSGFFRREIVVPCRERGAGRRPKGVQGLELKWAFLDHPPRDVDELVNSIRDSRKRLFLPPLTLKFRKHERGMRVYMAGRWIIGEKERGRRNNRRRSRGGWLCRVDLRHR